MHFRLMCAVGLAALRAVAATYSVHDTTLAEAALDSALSYPLYSSTIIQDGFRSQFLYNRSKVLFGNVKSLLYAQIRTLQKFGNYYHLWAGFEDGAFIGYYDKGQNYMDESFYMISWQSSYNHSCDYNTTKSIWNLILDVPESGLSYPGWPSSRETDMRLSSYCREFFFAKKDNGDLINSFYGHAYDCRRRPWYYSVKQNPVTQWTGVYVDRTSNEVAIPLCAPLFNATGYTTATPNLQYSSRVLPDSNSLLGVACTGFYLSDISKVLTRNFPDFETNAVYIREQSSGYLIAASTASKDGYYNSTTMTRVYALDSPDPLLKWSAEQITKYGNGSWPTNNVIIVRDANETVLPLPQYRNLSSVVANRSYYIASRPWTSNGLELDIVSIQLLTCPLNSERGCKHDGSCKDSELVCSQCIYPRTSLGGNAYCDVTRAPTPLPSCVGGGSGGGNADTASAIIISISVCAAFLLLVVMQMFLRPYILHARHKEFSGEDNERPTTHRVGPPLMPEFGDFSESSQSSQMPSDMEMTDSRLSESGRSSRMIKQHSQMLQDDHQEARSKQKESHRTMAQFLKEAGLSKYEQNLMNYGVESIEDLCDPQIINSTALATELGLSADEVVSFTANIQKHRLRRSSFSQPASISDAEIVEIVSL